MTLFMKSLPYAAAFTMLSASLTGIQAYAVKYRYDGSDNWIAEGGVNEYGDICAESREETQALETKLKQDGYILVSTAEKEISDEEAEKFQDGFWFSGYINPDSGYNEMYKVYIYEPTYTDFMEQTEDGGEMENFTRMELETSTVVVSYAGWYAQERIGKDCSAEVGDNIPDYYETGYIEIHSPVDAELTLQNDEELNYYRIHVTANVPYIEKMKAGAYHVTAVNGIDITDGEDTLPVKNLLQIETGDTEDSPYILSLQALEVKYGLATESPEMTDYTGEIPEERTVRENRDETETEEAESPLLIPLSVGILLLITAVLVIIFLFRKRQIPGNYAGANDENNGTEVNSHE